MSRPKVAFRIYATHFRARKIPIPSSVSTLSILHPVSSLPGPPVSRRSNHMSCDKLGEKCVAPTNGDRPKLNNSKCQSSGLTTPGLNE